MATFVKDPNDNPKDFYFNWNNWLQNGETIAISTVTVEAGLTKNSDSQANGIVTVNVSGGTNGTEYDVTNQITSSLGRVESQTFVILVLESNAAAAVHAPIAKVQDQPWNLLPLEEWRFEMGYNPFHFWQLSNAKAPVNSQCSSIVRQYAWQTANAVGRNEIRKAIMAAEDKLRGHLNYSVAPHYRMEPIQWPKYRDNHYSQRGYFGSDARWKTVQLAEGYIQAVGVEMLDPIQLESVVTYSDDDGDGLYDTFTLIAATTIFDPEEIAVYFSACDRMEGDDAGEKYRIAPLKIAIENGILTIKGRAWLCVKPLLYEGMGTVAIDPDVITNLAAKLDIYRRFTSTAGQSFDTSQAVLIWETRPWPYWAINPDPTGSATDPAGMAYALARVGIRNAILGIVGIGETTYDASSGTWSVVDWDSCRPPDRVIVRYLAGYPLESGRVTNQFRTIVSRLAAAELTRPICGCQAANSELYQWQYDLSRTAGSADEQYATSQSILNNPFGMKRGQVEAYRAIDLLRMDRGFAP